MITRLSELFDIDAITRKLTDVDPEDGNKNIFKTANIMTRFVVGGNLSSNKGINLPNLILNTKPLTHKDKKDLKFILDNEIDWIALSFVLNLLRMLLLVKHCLEVQFVVLTTQKLLGVLFLLILLVSYF